MITFMPGDAVRIRPLEQILATLDDNGTLDGLPFMPEMAQFCGQSSRVYQRAHKFCIENGDIRGFKDAVFLDGLRCSGAAHNGCGRACLIFWKEAWIERAVEATIIELTPGAGTPKITLQILNDKAVHGDQFFCQSTELMHAAEILPWWKFKQYQEDLFVAKAGLSRLLHSMVQLSYNKVAQWIGWNKFNAILGRTEKQPRVSLQLKSGELVRIKTLEEIRSTLDGTGRNRGLIFTREMAQFCGQTFRVSHRVERIILEHTPKMRDMRDTIVLEGVWCDGFCRRLCTRSSLYFWREAWVDRVQEVHPQPGIHVENPGTSPL